MASIKTISKILIIIPAYNEAGCIEKVVDNLEKNYPQYDYVVINDGSTDDTRKICARRGYNFMDLPVNTGLSGAIKSGMRTIMDMITFSSWTAMVSMIQSI